MNIHKEFLQNLLRLLILRLKRDLPKCAQANKVDYFHLLLVRGERALSLVYKLEVLVEAFDQANTDVADFVVVQVAEDALKEELLLVCSENELLLLVLRVAILVRAADSLVTRQVDPVEEAGLIAVKVWLVHKERPQLLDVDDAETDQLLRLRGVVLTLAD
jgi:hypothetical protein